jgi:dual oxidase maturation factor 1
MHIERVTQTLSGTVQATGDNSSPGDLQHQQQSMMTITSGKLVASSQHLGGDPFDGSAAPIVYMSDNRMPVIMDTSSAIIYIIFAALLLALISILPGIRRKRMTSFVGLATLLVVGTSILLSLNGTYWLTGTLNIYRSPYGALTSDTITGQLEVNIGLSSTNVTLYGRLVGADDKAQAGHHHQGHQEQKTTTSKQAANLVDYNERFHWDSPDRMSLEHDRALRRGLPYPILTITEFLSQDSDGFNWMRQLRQAGYFTSIALYAALASWCLTALVMCMLPVYLPHMMQITGAIMMSSVWIYTLLIESPKSFVIRLGEAPLEFEFGHTYVITFMAGALSMFAGVMMFVLQMNKPHDRMTIMDCDDYVKNQKALYGNDKITVDVFAPSKKAALNKATPPPMANQNVIIPIGDIEEKFGPKAKD